MGWATEEDFCKCPAKCHEDGYNGCSFCRPKKCSDCGFIVDAEHPEHYPEDCMAISKQAVDKESNVHENKNVV